MSSPMGPVRKRRNFKALQLTVSLPLPPNLEAEPIPTTRLAPVPVPAPVSSDAVSAVEQDGTVSPPTNLEAEPIPSRLAPISGAVSAEQYGTVSLAVRNAEIKYDLKGEDLKDLQELGQGNGGSVKKVVHIPTGTIMAKKIVPVDAKPAVRQQILRELHIMDDCHSKYIISFWGAFFDNPNICICMEFMDKGSLDDIYKKIGPIDIEIVGKVALAVLEGLTYLYDVHRIIHRNIKPSNILLNSKGEFKICDFGVSGELINSIANTFVGTSTYMSPEQIHGAQYTVKSDVWSLGISLIELAIGRFPFSGSTSDDEDSDLEGLSWALRSKKQKMQSTQKKAKRNSKGVSMPYGSKDKSLQGGGTTMSIFELLQHIVNEPAPRLIPEGRYPKLAESFIDNCLLKDPDRRKTPKDLLKDSWIDEARTSTVDLEDWAWTFWLYKRHSKSSAPSIGYLARLGLGDESDDAWGEK